MKQFYYVLGFSVLLWLIGYIFSIYFARTKKFDAKDTKKLAVCKNSNIFFAVCVIIASLSFEYLLITDLVIRFDSSFLLLFSVFSIVGILNGLKILIQRKLYYVSKDYGIGLVLSSVGVATMVLYALVNILLIRYVSILIIVIAIVFMIRSLKKQIEDRKIDEKKEEQGSHSSNIKSLSSKRWTSSFMTIMVISTLIMPIVGIIVGIHGIAEVWGNRKQGKILLIIGSTLTVIYTSLFFLFFFDKQAVSLLLTK